MTGHRGKPERVAGQTLRVVGSTQVPPRINASLQAACELLRDAHEPLTAISVSGQLPDSEAGALVMAAAESLAVGYGLAVDLRFDGAAYEVQFRRRAS